ncbi:MAG: DNA-3-methyladenine glycosylase [SAR324 cluster bacterium]|nr:DNA-3-methyladenine glycosylase [SAR324 cluster bacterium]
MGRSLIHFPGWSRLPDHVLPASFFDRDAQKVAQDLLGKVLRHHYQGLWLSCRIIETEAYYLHEKGSHASLGFTEKRKALFMPPGTIYMYFSRGGDSLNFSCRGEGNAVLIKSAFADPLVVSSAELRMMRELNPVKGSGRKRPLRKLCSGQTLLCRSLALKVREWDQHQMHPDRFYLADTGYVPVRVIQTTRMGIPKGRDEHLPYRFIDERYAAYCTKTPLRMQDPPAYTFLAHK